jgi:hypothetical protein
MISMIQSGPYLTPTVGANYDQSNTNVAGRGVNSRPDRIADGKLANPARDQYFDKTAFAIVPSGAGRFGNAGAGILRGPGTVAIAVGAAKSLLFREKFRLRLEGTFTNLPNHPNFLPPNMTITHPLFGRLTSVQFAENSTAC